MKPEVITLKINGRTHHAALAPNVTLLWRCVTWAIPTQQVRLRKRRLRRVRGSTNGEAVNSCLVLAWQAEGADILTSAGLGTAEQPHPLQAAFADTGAIQCGYCTPGLIISAKTLLDHNPHPTEADIREAIVGNLCRCTGYGHIIEAIQVAAEKLSAGGAQ
jgi:aerobic-type carbon monoxide dehydrogenase small subunit (CoxS/CutS family)